MRITGPIWFSAALILAAISIAVQCLLAWWLDRRAQARHAERLASYRDLRDTVLQDSVTGLGDVARTLREGYRALERTRGALLATGREIAAAAAGDTPGEDPHD